MTQPLGTDATQSTKRCWTCEATTPYNVGWCEACWEEVPQRIQDVTKITYHAAEPWGSAFRGAVSEGIRATRRNRTVAKVLSRTPLSLEDFGL